MPELNTDKLQNIWNSIFDTRFLSNYNDEEFASIFMLLDALKFQIIDLINKRKNCDQKISNFPIFDKCKKTKKVTPRKKETVLVDNEKFSKENVESEINLSSAKDSNPAPENKTVKIIPVVEDIENIGDETIDIVDDSDTSVGKYAEKSPVLKSKNEYTKRKRTLKKKLEFGCSPIDLTDNLEIKNAKTNFYTFKLPKRAHSDESNLTKNPSKKLLILPTQFSPRKEKSPVPEIKERSINLQSETFYQPLHIIPGNLVANVSPTKKKSPEIKERSVNLQSETFCQPLHIIPGNFVVNVSPTKKKSPKIKETTVNVQSETFYQPLHIPDNFIINETESPSISPIPREQPILRDCNVIEQETKKEPLKKDSKYKNLDELLDSYDCIPKANKEPAFAYRRDACRKKAERAKLMGRACKDCERYYELMGENDPKNLQKRLNQCSRHRDNYELSYTPQGFWNPLFEPAQKK